MYYPQDIRGTGSGASVAVGRIGSIIGPLLAGVLLGGGMSASGVVQYMVPVAAVAGAAVFALSFCRRPA
jgi:AAHS family 3-hydroxyphenylpropionic acid transporter